MQPDQPGREVLIQELFGSIPAQPVKRKAKADAKSESQIRLEFDDASVLPDSTTTLIQVPCTVPLSCAAIQKWKAANTVGLQVEQQPQSSEVLDTDFDPRVSNTLAKSNADTTKTQITEGGNANKEGVPATVAPIEQIAAQATSADEEVSDAKTSTKQAIEGAALSQDKLLADIEKIESQSDSPTPIIAAAPVRAPKRKTSKIVNEPKSGPLYDGLEGLGIPDKYLYTSAFYSPDGPCEVTIGMKTILDSFYSGDKMTGKQRRTKRREVRKWLDVLEKKFYILAIHRGDLCTWDETTYKVFSPDEALEQQLAHGYTHWKRVGCSGCRILLSNITSDSADT